MVPSFQPGRHVIRDLALLALAQALLRVLSPLQAHALLLRIGPLWPEVRSPDDARRVLARIGAHGTCLGRAFAVAARAPTADVVIAVDPGRSPFFAHAWLEMNGAPVDPLDAIGAPIARIRGPLSRA
jgi:hypothetical protein